MSEALPDPALPIFGEETVSYTVTHPRQEPDSLGQGGDTAFEYIELPVDEIDNLHNPSLRDALWQQFRSEHVEGSPVLMPFVNHEGKHTSNVWVSRKKTFVQLNEETKNVRSYTVPTSLIGETFTLDGPIKDEDYPDYLERKRQENLAQQKSASWISRLLKRNR